MPFLDPFNVVGRLTYLGTEGTARSATTSEIHEAQ